MRGRRVYRPNLFVAKVASRRKLSCLSTNGWSFWQVEGGGGKSQTLEQVRGAYLKG